jgi:hypothetical protein
MHAGRDATTQTSPTAKHTAGQPHGGRMPTGVEWIEHDIRLFSLVATNGRDLGPACPDASSGKSLYGPNPVWFDRHPQANVSRNRRKQRLQLWAEREKIARFRPLAAHFGRAADRPAPGSMADRAICCQYRENRPRSLTRN